MFYRIKVKHDTAHWALREKKSGINSDTLEFLYISAISNK